jgi:hypothetical protein
VSEEKNNTIAKNDYKEHWRRRNLLYAAPEIHCYLDETIDSVD